VPSPLTVSPGAVLSPIPLRSLAVTDQGQVQCRSSCQPDIRRAFLGGRETRAIGIIIVSISLQPSRFPSPAHAPAIPRQCVHTLSLKQFATPRPPRTYLIQIDHRPPELVLQLVEVPHADLPKVTRMVFIEICAVMMLSSSHTTSTRMLAMLANTSVAGGDMAAADGDVSLCAASTWSILGQSRCG